MNYSFRNEALWRWCLATFIVSLIIALVLTLFEPWDWTISTGLLARLSKTPPRWMTWLTPGWLDWSITNTLFVLAYVWMKTGKLALAPLWTKYPPTKLIRAFLQGLLVTCFCGVYSLPGLIIASIVLSVAVYIYFIDELSQPASIRSEEELYYEYDCYGYDEFIFYNKLPKYSVASIMIFFYTVIVLYGFNELAPPLGIWKFVTILVGMPLIYINIAFALIIAIIALIFLIIKLQWLTNKIAETLRAIGRELFIAAKFLTNLIVDWLIVLFLTIGTVLTVIICAIFWMGSTMKDLCRWLFPPRPTTA